MKNPNRKAKGQQTPNPHRGHIRRRTTDRPGGGGSSQCPGLASTWAHFSIFQTVHTSCTYCLRYMICFDLIMEKERNDADEHCSIIDHLEQGRKAHVSIHNTQPKEFPKVCSLEYWPCCAKNKTTQVIREQPDKKGQGDTAVLSPAPSFQIHVLDSENTATRKQFLILFSLEVPNLKAPTPLCRIYQYSKRSLKIP